jgi:hypothetical protein
MVVRMVIISLFALIFRGFAGVMTFHVYDGAATLAVVTGFAENFQ